MYLYVIYGSETELLETLYNKDENFYICIFNSKIKKRRQNAKYIDDLRFLASEVEKRMKSSLFSKIVFVGAAFKTQNTLFHQTDEQAVQEMLDVNINNYVKITKILLPFMQKMRAGNFIYLSSFRSNVSCRGVSIYSASKAFGENFFEVIGKENGVFGIYSSSIRMGYFDGRMTNLLNNEKQSQLKIRAGNRRFGNGEELVKAIKFIIENPYTNGGTIDLTGGINHEF